VTAYAFLARGAASIFSGRALPVPTDGLAGEWFTAEPGEILALTVSDLPRRLDEELWEIELDEPGTACRLLRRVESWTEAVALELAEAWAWRARDQAVRVLERHAEYAAAAELGALRRLGDVERWAAQAGVDRLPDHAALAADAAALARGGRPESWRHPAAPHASQPAAVTAANLGFVVAHCAGLEASDERGPEAYPAGVAAERAWQATMLATRLGLPGASGDAAATLAQPVTPAQR
jgi:hypothetical protein